jgi:hypothetical protein
LGTFDHDWDDRKRKASDCVCYRVGDTFPFIVGKRTCRLVKGVNARAILRRPDIMP